MQLIGKRLSFNIELIKIVCRERKSDFEKSQEDKNRMKNRDIWKQMASDYFLIQAETALSIGIIGSIFLGEEKISYSYFFLPAIIGIVCMLPCLITYLKEDMTVKQIIAQRVIEWIVLEIAFICLARYLAGDKLEMAGYVALGISVTFFDAATYGISYMLEKRETDELNEILKQNNEINE